MNILMQKIVPQHGLSRLMGFFGNCQCKHYKNWMIKKFIRAYGVNMKEAIQQDPTTYKSFNDFFTRELKPGVRDLAKPASAIISPADGAISEFGRIDQGRLLQAKGSYYALDTLVADKSAADDFVDGTFMTIYLSPKDYHRVHMPIGGQLKKMIYVPGSLFSVNEAAVAGVPGLFARNERAVCLFETDIGPVAMIMVGAMIVASIHTTWHGQIAPQRSRHLTEWNYQDQNIVLKRGDEMGFFQMGSTVIMLYPKDKIHLNEKLAAEQTVRLGDMLAEIVLTKSP